MNTTVTYKCPNCDAGLIFNAEEQKFSCEFCLSHFAEEELAATSTAERVEEMERENAELQTADASFQEERADAGGLHRRQ